MKLAGMCAALCLYVVGIATMADAATSGSYRCLGRSNSSFFLEVVHHNPNATVQNIKRIRIFDATGAQYIDSGPITQAVPGRGSFAFFAPAPASGEDEILVIVNWAQGADVAAPTVRANHYILNSSGDVSLSHAACP
jgi:hypothetical protein